MTSQPVLPEIDTALAAHLEQRIAELVKAAAERAATNVIRQIGEELKGLSLRLQFQGSAITDQFRFEIEIDHECSSDRTTSVEGISDVRRTNTTPDAFGKADRSKQTAAETQCFTQERLTQADLRKEFTRNGTLRGRTPRSVSYDSIGDQALIKMTDGTNLSLPNKVAQAIGINAPTESVPI